MNLKNFTLIVFAIAGLSLSNVMGQTSLANNFTTIDGWSTKYPEQYTFSNSPAGELEIVGTAKAYTTVDYTFAAIDVSKTPYIQLDIKSATPVTIRIDFLDTAGYTTNASDTRVTIPGNDTYSNYIFDFTGKFSQKYPSDSSKTPVVNFPVNSSQISMISIFINPGVTASPAHTVHFDNLKIGSNVVIPPPPSGIRVNQIGYYPISPKIGVVAQVEATKFYIVSASGTDTVFTGDLKAPTLYAASGEMVSQANFSAFQTEGSYTLNAGGLKSPVFKIAPQVHNKVAKGLLKSFYFNRASTALVAPHAELWPRDYDESSDPEKNVSVHASGKSDIWTEGYEFSSLKGWFDAGDYNKYMVNSGITTYTMLALYEHFPSYFDTLNTFIPESGNNLPDILDEVKWQLDWFLTTQVPDGSVFHKITQAGFGPDVMPNIDLSTRYAVQRGTAATCDFAAVMAQASRIFSTPAMKEKLPGFADTCLARAIMAFNWAIANPNVLVEDNAEGIETGGYTDGYNGDEIAWARMELFITTKDLKYYNRNEIVPTTVGFPLPGYTNSNTLGLMSMVNYRSQIAATLGTNVSDTTIFKNRLLSLANSIKNNVSAYGTPMGSNIGHFGWGSNSGAGNMGMIMLQAYRFTNDPSFLKGALANLDYVLGRNATGYSFVTGYGTVTPMVPHHRISKADGVDLPVPGMVVGGANGRTADGVSGYPRNAARSFLDDYGSYSTNEPAINYTAPVMYVANAIEALIAGGGNSILPVTRSNNVASIAVSLYPNPSKEDVSLSFVNKGKAKITIADVTGKIMIEKSNTQNGAAHEVISIATLEPGIYFVSVTNESGAVTKKLIKN